MKNIDIAIADDHKLYREGIVDVLEDMGYHVVMQAKDGNALLQELYNAVPDLCILDICSGRSSGLDICRSIKITYPSVKVLIHSMDNTREIIENAYRNGADGFIEKGSSPLEMNSEIERIVFCA